MVLDRIGQILSKQMLLCRSGLD